MGGRTESREIAADLLRAARRFAAWRQGRTIGARIPQPLWNSAVALAGRHGLSRTATALGLDYYALKKRVEAQAPLLKRDPVRQPVFVELPASPLAPSGECLIECTHVNGASLRIRLAGHEAPDLGALARSFWNIE